MKPTDDKTRENIVKAKQRGEKRETIAQWLNVSLSTIDKVWKLFTTTGSYFPKPYLGRKSIIDEATERRILDKIKEKPGITLEELRDKLSIPLTISGLHRKLKRMGVPYKKKREEWAEKQAELGPEKLVFIDENSIRLSPKRGSAPNPA